MYKKLNKKGFTLIELIVVIAVIGILVLVAAPKFLGYTRDAHVTGMKADVKVLSSAALVYYIDAETSDKPINELWPIFPENHDGGVSEEFEVLQEDGSIIPVKGYFIDPSKLDSKFIKNIKNDLDNYVLVINESDIEEGSGVNVGDVYHTTGVKGKDNTSRFGIILKGELVRPVGPL